MILVIAVAVSYLMARPSVFVRQSSAPVFMGSEITVQRTAARPAAVVKAKPAIKAQAVSQPLPQPKIAAPLPILPPRISYRVLPKYPASALEQGLAGTVLLSVFVGGNGSAQKVAIKSSSGVAELDTAALNAVSQWKFDPATQGGRAVESWFEFPFRFEVK
jgi:protein TonB